MKFKNPMLVVTDIDKSVEFYKKVFGLRVIMDFGANKTLTGGLALQTSETYKEFIGTSNISFGGNNFEVYFEEDDFDRFADRLKEYDIEYCELTDKTLHDGYIEYTLLYDMIANRITIDEVKAENGCLRLMKNLVWEYDALPHALIAGGTGGGKTYFLLTLIEALLHTNAILYILDPKNADLADLGTVMGNVYHTKEEMIDCVNAFYEGMVQRSEEMKQHPNYKTGENYAYLGLPPCFLIFDEYVAFFEMLGTKESVSLLSQLKKIVMLGRQAGYFLIVACQRPDAKYFSDGIRDNFNFRVGLGRISELGYGMLFGSDVKKQFFQKRIKGRGYCDVGTSVISEFYTPLVPKGYDFLQNIGSLTYASPSLSNRGAQLRWKLVQKPLKVR